MFREDVGETPSRGGAREIVLLVAGPSLPWIVSAASLIFLAILGALGAWAGKAPIARAVLRVGFWGAVAMGVTMAIGSLFGTTVG